MKLLVEYPDYPTHNKVIDNVTGIVINMNKSISVVTAELENGVFELMSDGTGKCILNLKEV